MSLVFNKPLLSLLHTIYINSAFSGNSGKIDYIIQTIILAKQSNYGTHPTLFSKNSAFSGNSGKIYNIIQAIILAKQSNYGTYPTLFSINSAFSGNYYLITTLKQMN